MTRDTRELTQKYLAEADERRRAEELRRDPSSIPGMTQAELNEVIATGSISVALLRKII